MSADDQGARRAADDGLRVVDHLGHRDPDRRLVAEHDLAERIADEEQRDPGLVEDLGGRVVVGGQHRRCAAPSAYSLAMSTTVRRRRACRCVALMLAPASGSVVASSLRGGVALVQRGATRSSRRSATARLDCSGRSSRDPSAARIETRFVSVPKPGARLRRRRWRRAGRRPCAGASRRRGRASRSRPRTRPGSGAGRAARGSRSPSLSRPWTIRATSASRSGVGSSSQRQRRRSRCELACRRRGRPEVGDGGGHDQGIEPGRAVGAVASPAGARRAGRPSTRPGRPRPRRAAATSTFAAMSVTRAPRSSAASAMADAHLARSSGCR